MERIQTTSLNFAFQSFLTFVGKNWFKCLILGFLIFLFLRKDVSLQMRMANDSVQQPEIQLAEAGMAPFSLAPNVSSKKKKKKQHVRLANDATAVSNVLTEKQKAQAANYSNLGLILHPELAKKNQIDPNVMEYKRAKVDNYIKRFAKTAQSEMHKYGVPASITLAQGLLESNVGESYLSTTANNHFGMKCFSRTCKPGHCINALDDSHKDFFRNYETAWESFRAHSELLQGKRYAALKELKQSDYKGWAKGLSKAGYATDPAYAQKLIDIIEALELTKYDKTLNS